MHRKMNRTMNCLARELALRAVSSGLPQHDGVGQVDTGGDDSLHRCREGDGDRLFIEAGICF